MTRSSIRQIKSKSLKKTKNVFSDDDDDAVSRDEVAVSRVEVAEPRVEVAAKVTAKGKVKIYFLINEKNFIKCFFFKKKKSEKNEKNEEKEDIITITYKVNSNHPFYNLNEQPGYVNVSDIAEGFDPENVNFDFIYFFVKLIINIINISSQRETK